MQKIKQLYRANYAGENIITRMTWTNADWQKETEFVPNQITNTQISNRAVILGNGPSRLQLYPQGDLFALLKNHKGGLLAAGAVQTYGCNAIVRDFTPDFVVANDAMAAELVNGGYCENNIIYGTAEMVIAYPGKFYLIPQNPNWDMGATAAYLACFDGHTQVYLMGFDHHTQDQYYHHCIYAGTRGYPEVISPTTEEYFALSLKTVMDTYPRVEFIRVMPTENWYMHDTWKYQLNLRQITFDDFVHEVDL
jgi:hypothetical protein